MQMLQSRLNGIRQDIKSFLLSIHELSADDNPVLQDLREYSGSSPDDPGQAAALLYPGASASAGFDPLHYVQLAADHLKQHGAEGQFSFTGPMPSYTAEGKEVTRRFDCAIVFVDGIDPLPHPAEAKPGEPEPGCC